MNELVDLLIVAAKGLFNLIPLWAGAKTQEQKDAILATAKQIVTSLDAYFAAADATDKAAKDATQKEIDEAP